MPAFRKNDSNNDVVRFSINRGTNESLNWKID